MPHRCCLIRGDRGLVCRRAASTASLAGLWQSVQSRGICIICLPGDDPDLAHPAHFPVIRTCRCRSRPEANFRGEPWPFRELVQRRDTWPWLSDLRRFASTGTPVDSHPVAAPRVIRLVRNETRYTCDS